jgi:hypothetical protein
LSRFWLAAARSFLILGLAAPFFAGCTQRQTHKPVEPAQEQSTSSPAVDHFDIRPYLAAARLGRWTYRRTKPGHEDGKAVTYTRLASAERIMEGKLATREFLPIPEYLVKESAASQPAAADWRRPRAPLKGGTAFMFELVEPMDPYPPELAVGAPLVSTTPVIYYEYDGRLLARGTLTRTAEIEGLEQVEVPAGTFSNCLRIRVDFSLHIPWLLNMDWKSTLWFSKEVGEVMRVQEMVGWFWILWFRSSHEYRLVSAQPVLHPPEPETIRPARWQYGAVLLDRAIPEPVIGGLVVDYSDLRAGTGPTTAPAATQPAVTAAVPAP